MRRRSGALHCDSQESLLQLAQLVQQTTGLFYDAKHDAKHTKLHFQQRSNRDAVSLSISNSNGNQRRTFDGFEYSAQSEYEIQEKEELCSAPTLTCKHYVILCEDIARYFSETGELVPAYQTDRIQSEIEVAVQKSNGSLVRFWVIRAENIRVNQRTGNPYLRSSLFEMYLQKSDKIFVYDQTNHSYKAFNSYEDYRAERECQNGGLPLIIC